MIDRRQSGDDRTGTGIFAGGDFLPGGTLLWPVNPPPLMALARPGSVEKYTVTFWNGMISEFSDNL